jgi:hypothetical protein
MVCEIVTTNDKVVYALCMYCVGTVNNDSKLYSHMVYVVELWLGIPHEGVELWQN